MKILISHPSSPQLLFQSHSLPWKNATCYRFFSFPRKPPSRHQSPTPSCLPASSPASSATYNGWDDLRLRVDTETAGESNQLRSFLIIDDRKYLFVYVLGFVCALAISRVRVPSIIVVPATALIFAVGFSFGFVNGGSRGGLGSIGSKRKAKRDEFKVYGDKLKNLANLLNKFDGRIEKLKNDIRKAVDYQRVEIGDLEGYAEDVELMGSFVLTAKKVVENCVNGISAEDNDVVERNSNQKSGRKKKETGGFDLFQIVSRFFLENATVTRTSKKKEAAKNDSKVVNTSSDELLDSSSETGMTSKFGSKRVNPRDSGDAYNYQSLDFNREARSGFGRKEINRGHQDHKFNSMVVDEDEELMQDQTLKRFLDNRELNYHNSRLTSLDDRNFTLRMSEQDEIGRWAPHNSLHDDINFGRNEKYFPLENSKMRCNYSEAYESSHYRVNSEYETFRSCFRRETGGKDDLHVNDDQSKLDKGFVDSSSSSMFSDDALFNEHLVEAGNLLKQAKECLRVGDNEIHVEQMLYDSAKLLSEALSLKPMSLLAIGQLGNTYLLHGELKFRVSRELRYFLSGNNGMSLERWSNILVSKDEPLPSKGRVVNLLVNVCEECEELLIEAGRKYRMALSIDRDDVRALYNWGLALSFRAQLIADIGPESAVDADKLFLAAIDKFDAMMTRGNIYAPDALFRWGMALQQRSRLRPSNSRDKVKLLQQARRLYKDALDMGSNDLQPQVREALSSCMFELNP